jgi:hypothetical protein
MASDVMTLFNMPSSQEIGQAYLNSQMVSPAQMGQQGLLQQGISMAGNQGAMLGYGAGRLLGGMAPQEARARGIEEAMAKVQSMGLTSDAEMYSALSRELAARGLTQDAFAANKEARTAMRDEQLVKKGAIDIDKATFDLANAKEEAKFLEQRIAESEAAKGVDNPEAQGLKRQLETKKKALEALDADIYSKKVTANAAATNAAANASRVSMDKIQGNLKMLLPRANALDPWKEVVIGNPTSGGKIVGNSGKTYTADEWDKGGRDNEEKLYLSKLGLSSTQPNTTPTPAAAKPKSGKLPTASEFYYTEGQ